jgi:hypothetical protein
VRKLLALIAIAPGCGGTPPPRAAPTLDQQVMAAADAAAECMASAGASCLYAAGPGADMIDAWRAQTELEVVAEMPPPLLPGALAAAAKLADDAGETARVAAAEATRAAALARDLSCRATRVYPVGVELAARRETLVERAEGLGLGATRTGDAVAALAGAAAPLDRARLVELRCRAGALFLLMAPPARPIDDDEDPAAHAGGGWRAFFATWDELRALRGVRAPGPDAAVVADAPPRDAVDPWIPVTEVDL